MGWVAFLEEEQTVCLRVLRGKAMGGQSSVFCQ